MMDANFGLEDLLDSPFLISKITIPALDERCIARSELTERLDESLRPGLRLTLVAAPAGYGKTTLVSQWIRRQHSHPGVHFAWFGIEPGDDDPVQFYVYAIRAIQQVYPGFGEKALALAQSPQSFQPELAAAILAAELAEVNHPLLLVLDDYHLIHQTTIHEGLAVWLDHIPAHIHLILITRSDPALPLHRYRARGQILEIRQGDLRFDREEVSQFITSRTQTRLSDSDLNLLEERMEGWPAGLQMAAIRLHDARNPHSVLDAVSGNQRFILDYLAEEVFNAQPDDVQRFLLCSARLDRFCPDLIDSLGILDPADKRDSREIIQYLEECNLFIVPLDREQEWYRYHHLFRDLLILKAKQTKQTGPVSPEQIQLHAAEWYLAHGWLSEAIQAFILAGKFERAAGLVEKHTIQLFADGQLHAILAWIKLLPADLAEQRPWLCLYRAWACVFAGLFEDTRRSLDQLDSLLPLVENTPDSDALRYEARAIRAMLAITTADIPTAFHLTESIQAASTPARLFAESVLVWCKAYALRLTGQVLPAVDLFRQVVEIGYRSQNAWTILSGSVDYGQVLRLTGQLDQAEKVFRDALRQVTQTNQGQGFIGRLESFLAAVLLERDQLDEAYRLARAGVEHNRSWENPNHIVYGYWVLARVLSAIGNQLEAEKMLAKAEKVCLTGRAIPPLVAGVGALRLRYEMQNGNKAAAEEWLRAHPPQTGPGGELQFAEGTTRARILLSSGQQVEAAGLLESMRATAKNAGQTSWLIEISCLLALAGADETSSRSHLLEAVNLGIPRGFRRIYLEDGLILLQRMAALPADKLDPGVKAGVQALLAAHPAPAPAQVKPVGVAGPLTAREREILALVAQGLSNHEIGARLYISAGTVKAHTAAIFRKWMLPTAPKPSRVPKIWVWSDQYTKKIKRIFLPAQRMRNTSSDYRE